MLVTCVLVLCLGGIAAAGATAATGDRAKASSAAIQAVGGGRVTSIERRSNGRGWEVYVRRAAKNYEVKVSRSFRVLSVERQGANHDAGDDHGSGGHGSDDG
jgi:hypothetical protein